VGLAVAAGDLVGVRLRDGGDGWLAEREGDKVTLSYWRDHRVTRQWSGPAAAGALQVLDDGTELRVLAGDHLAVGPVRHSGLGGATGAVAGTAWPRTLPCPANLAVPRVAPNPAASASLVVDQRFSLPAGALAGADLEGTAAGSARWARTAGSQVFTLDEAGLHIPPTAPPVRRSKVAALTAPSGVRTAYTLPWSAPTADLRLELVPPGTGRHQGHGSRAGLIFVQDDRHALVVNVWLDDDYDGTSVSSFFRLGGHEEVFDAIWVNVGRRITWGRPAQLGVRFDGDAYQVAVDGRPVLQRALTTVYPDAPPLQISRVGVVANWEFGQDTGTVLRRFQAWA
jgi:hypothetical protein